MDDFLGNLFGQPAGRPHPQPEKAVQLHGKEIGGVFYIRADDVVALLEINGLLPNTVGALRKRITS